MHLMAVKKSTKRSVFVVHIHFKDGKWGTSSLRNGKKKGKGSFSSPEPVVTN